MDQEELRITAAKDYLCAYQLCVDMLNIRRYERKRAKRVEEPDVCADILTGNEAYWRARMYEVEHLIASLRNGREKLILYSRYIKGESIELASDLLGISRRTGYRVHRKGLLTVGAILERKKSNMQAKSIE